MIILHCLKEKTWNDYKNKEFYGEKYIETEGFIHCSDIYTFYKVAPNFLNVEEKLILLCIDTEKTHAEIKWEDNYNCGTTFPHIYGLLNTDSVINVLPFLKDSNGDFLLNTELQ